MILKNLPVNNWSIRVLKIGMALSIFLSFYSCNSDDEDDLIGNWVYVGDFEGIPRSSAVAVVLDEKAYVATGYNGEDDKERFNDIWEFDPATYNWRQRANMPDEALSRDGAVGFSAAGKVYLGTGYAQYVEENKTYTKKMNDFWEFDPDANSWTRIADFPGTARYGAVAFSINDKGYVGTGYDDYELKDFYRYDPATGTWTEPAEITSYPGAKRRDAVAFVIANKAYVCTGISNGDYKGDFYYYDPDANSWEKLNHIEDATDYDFDDDYDDIVRTGGTAFVMGGKGYICTSGRGGVGSSVWEYNPDTDLWAEKTSFEGGTRMDAVGFAINDIGYIATGRSSSYYFNDVFRFEPNAEQDDYDND